ncbi:diguanylate cyclase [Solirubrobacter sp. CPCC 204708]|uniref:Diguanylate cyclase n=1 Tax=Solirubrobacter deserti TaxID=2282478 RepID=A0ABT4RNE9_9ACTN|nr:GGDEF domain-containing protein [Solirubrobacter deserti]MBE2317460.1 diguanylate cyclase [Solirubrobacter deserti]MDA0140042.1 diguanylate cyclase [Solirubrobacter deserti]
MLAVPPSPLPSLALLPEAAVVLAPGGLVLVSSPPADELFRCTPVGRSLADLVTDPARLWAAVEGLAAGAHVAAVPLEGVRADGVPFGLDASVRVLEGGGVLCVLRELDTQITTSLEAAFDHMPIGMALFNADGQVVRLNPAMCALLGRPAEEVLGVRDQEFTHEDDRAADVDAAWRILRGEMHSWQCEKRYVRPDGEIVWTFANLTFVRDEYGRPLCWVGQFQDITELRRLASRDPLTDALNRRAFDAELSRCPAGALLLLDLDGFKDINDVHGHEAGDEVLRGIAGVVGGRLRRDDVLARLGGDEFAVLLPRCPMDEAASVGADLLALIAARRFEFDGVERGVTASIGIAPVGADTLAAADRAMYDAKAVGGGRVRIHRAL